MVWVITIAVFLATVVAALLVFLIYSQKEQIKRVLKEKRKEERAKLAIELELATPHDPPAYEKYPTENTSRHGARVVSSKRWQPHEHVLVRLPFKSRRETRPPGRAPLVPSPPACAMTTQSS
jgi:hypothetical protein